MRKYIVAGNWKMNLTYDQAKDLLLKINRFIVNHDQKATVIVAPPFVSLKMAKDTLHSNHVHLAAQNVSWQDSGPYTGEISAEMLKSVGVDYCIIGHSERRQQHHETNEHLEMKAKMLLARDIDPIFCCGETEEQRKKGSAEEVVKNQIENALFSLSAEEFQNIVIAYEPVWAIGTGNTPSNEDIENMHKHIRDIVSKKYGADVAHEVSILYGGSLNPSNASEIFSLEDVDGGLVGSASLDDTKFTRIIEELDKAKQA